MTIENLLEKNRRWSENQTYIDPDFFQRLSLQQTPEYLWIGCSDSRVPANQVVGLDPGELFVHRNIANVVLHTDFNCLSVLQFAVDVLKVRHVIVCGHYGCGGVKAALGNTEFGLVDNWLRHIKDVYYQHQDEVNAIKSEEARIDRLCELNVMEQVNNLAKTKIVQHAWDRGQELAIHGLIYSIKDGLLQELNVNARTPEFIDPIFRMQSDN
ncbi:carbonate dehydratase [Bacterioplanoides sp. SCSIO 12839]|uniref:carbonate dehydratase n=1 Tax=Bacterioplanoides sp. SCSIO 12839 TaxID=2829569 RepID=UPI002105E16E|nr:carbonate dehydratase [Bacterioplanoides sp. SCSIO 12839]UTW49304.1 carbonate dehydratase [Bacterioplanoides sp. SCSIO 12839]